MKAVYYKLRKEDKENISYHRKTFQEIDDIGFNILGHL